MTKTPPRFPFYANYVARIDGTRTLQRVTVTEDFNGYRIHSDIPLRVPRLNLPVTPGVSILVRKGEIERIVAIGRPAKHVEART